MGTTTPYARTAPRLGEDHANLIRSRIELRDGALYWRHTDNAWWNSRYAGLPVCIQTAPCGYRRLRVEGQKYLIHRVIWLLHHGRWPVLVDHINRDRADNRIENLREVTAAENQWNSGPALSNPSGYPGVQVTKPGRWVARINDSGKRRHLGTFKNREDAIHARKRAEMERASLSGAQA